MIILVPQGLVLSIIAAFKESFRSCLFFQTGLFHPDHPRLHLTAWNIKWLTCIVFFLIAINSVERLGELQTLSCKHPYLRLLHDGVLQRFMPFFVQKVPPSEDINRESLLPVLFPEQVNEQQARGKVRELRIIFRKQKSLEIQ